MGTLPNKHSSRHFASAGEFAALGLSQFSVSLRMCGSTWEDIQSYLPRISEAAVFKGWAGRQALVKQDGGARMAGPLKHSDLSVNQNTLQDCNQFRECDLGKTCYGCHSSYEMCFLIRTSRCSKTQQHTHLGGEPGIRVSNQNDVLLYQ